MITKTILISALSISALGGTGLALSPQNPVEAVTFSGGPVALTLGGDAPVTLDGAQALDPSLTVTLKSGRTIQIVF